jgi:hypothetical protein
MSLNNTAGPECAELENVIKRIVLFGEEAAVLQAKNNNHLENCVNSSGVPGEFGLKELKEEGRSS